MINNTKNENKNPSKALFQAIKRFVRLARQNNNDASKKLCVSKASSTFSLFTITYYFPKIDKSFYGIAKSE